MLKKCGTCRYWEEIYPDGSRVGDNQRGYCVWLDTRLVPMWFSPREADLRALVLAGAGKTCEAWKERVTPRLGGA